MNLLGTSLILENQKIIHDIVCVLFHLGGKIHMPHLMKLPLLTQEVQVHKETTRGLEGDGNSVGSPTPAISRGTRGQPALLGG